MEGEKTEASYFRKNFSNRDYNLEFVFLSKNNGGVSPKKLKNRIDTYFSTIKTKTKLKKEKDKLDSVWIV